MLLTAEKLFLISINFEKGSIYEEAKPNLKRMLSYAILYDLSELGMVKFQGGKVSRSDEPMHGNSILKDCFDLIRQIQKERTIEYWLTILDNRVNLFSRIEDHLITKRGIIKKELRNGLFMNRVTYQLVAPSQINRIMREVREGLLKGNHSVKSLILLKLIGACSLYEIIFPKHNQKDIYRICNLVEDELNLLTTTTSTIHSSCVMIDTSPSGMGL